MTVYVDGAEAYSATYAAGASLTSGGTFILGQEQDNIGGGFDSGQILVGEIHDLRIWDDVRTSQEIADNAGQVLSDPGGEANLVANWQMSDNGSGGIADAAGNHDLTMAGDAALNIAGSVLENVADGTIVGTVRGVDPDAGETLAYSLTDDAGGQFVIDSAKGQITLADGSLLDYEMATSHDVTVRVTDAAGATYDETFAVNLTDVVENQTPTDISVVAAGGTVATGEIVDLGSNSFSIDRWLISHSGDDIDLLAQNVNGSNLDAIIHLFRDNGDGTFTHIASNDDGAAGSDGSTSSLDSYLGLSGLTAGDYILAVGSYNTTSSEAIASGASDNASLSQYDDSGTHQITLTGSAVINGISTDPTDGGDWGDPNGHAAVVPGAAILSVDENAANGVVVGTVSGSDPDAGDTLTYSVTEDAGGVSRSTAPAVRLRWPTVQPSITKQPCRTTSRCESPTRPAPPMMRLYGRHS